ncbi:hypothetical protein FH609_030135 [Streptomyces sp. 3MP-14]|uniref:Uncharacterized protein n=1 Tax=Streptomyces mimosae TaxID=2586635 RepID=A0A5N5ZN14_9ACTN|nr:MULTISPECIES: hypothetical protein [Streptomyces]KAB8157891.1 hypothetical protein FH607_029725 [Streptomyces mimosae]KAB8172392.1 hypothetical protein FH609_030135 [Streptomyces sp. 3MP-14]
MNTRQLDPAQGSVGRDRLRRRLWRRGWIAWPDTPPDRTTEVHWLQLDAAYCDLRQPPPQRRAAAPSLETLDHDGALTLARQEAFAGELLDHGRWVEWTRPLSLHPPGATPDAGRLRLAADGALIETGVHQPYTERWLSLPQPTDLPCERLALTGVDGGPGLLLRLGDRFGYLRDRAPGVLDPAAPLTEQLHHVRGDLGRVRALVDFELSLGQVVSTPELGEVWRITRSTLPWRVGHDLAPAPGPDLDRLTVADHAPDGSPTRRAWHTAHTHP